MVVDSWPRKKKKEKGGVIQEGHDFVFEEDGFVHASEERFGLPEGGGGPERGRKRKTEIHKKGELSFSFSSEEGKNATGEGSAFPKTAHRREGFEAQVAQKKKEALQRRGGDPLGICLIGEKATRRKKTVTSNEGERRSKKKRKKKN